MKFKSFYIFLFASVVIFSQCKKDKETEPDTNTSATAYTDICTPKTGNNQYVPLAVNNKWSYGAQTMLGNLPVTCTVTKDTVVAGGKTYFVATYTQNILPKSYQRYNSGDSLVGLDPDSLAQGKLRDQLLVPATPTVNQTWTDPRNNTYTVQSLTATLTIGSCTYTNLLQIHVVGSTGTADYYYKKGIGLISIVCASGCNFTSANLTSMSIY